MRLWIGIAAIAAALFGIWWWRGRLSRDGGQSVSSTWLDDHIRGRRD